MTVKGAAPTPDFGKQDLTRVTQQTETHASSGKITKGSTSSYVDGAIAHMSKTLANTPTEGTEQGSKLLSSLAKLEAKDMTAEKRIPLTRADKMTLAYKGRLSRGGANQQAIAEANGHIQNARFHLNQVNEQLMDPVTEESVEAPQFILASEEISKGVQAIDTRLQEAKDRGGEITRNPELKVLVQKRDQLISMQSELAILATMTKSLGKIIPEHAEPFSQFTASFLQGMPPDVKKNVTNSANRLLKGYESLVLSKKQNVTDQAKALLNITQNLKEVKVDSQVLVTIYNSSLQDPDPKAQLLAFTALIEYQELHGDIDGIPKKEELTAVLSPLWNVYIDSEGKPEDLKEFLPQMGKALLESYEMNQIKQLNDTRGTKMFDPLFESTKKELQDLQPHLGAGIDSQLRLIEELKAPKEEVKAAAKGAIEAYLSSLGNKKQLQDIVKKGVSGIKKMNIDAGEENIEKAQLLAACLYSLKDEQLQALKSDQELSLNIQGFLTMNGLQDLSNLFF